MEILPLSPRLQKYLRKRNLLAKYEKQARLLVKNPKHPSLRIELLEPHERGIYSFRLDRQYRALFFFRDDVATIEVITITSHYQ